MMRHSQEGCTVWRVAVAQLWVLKSFEGSVRRLHHVTDHNECHRRNANSSTSND
jgi:hypothetical protein